MRRSSSAICGTSPPSPRSCISAGRPPACTSPSPACPRRSRGSNANLRCLFTWTRTNVELTEAGTELLHRGRRLLADLDGTVARVRMAGRGQTGLVRVGVAHLANRPSRRRALRMRSTRWRPAGQAGLKCGLIRLSSLASSPSASSTATSCCRSASSARTRWVKLLLALARSKIRICHPRPRIWSARGIAHPVSPRVPAGLRGGKLPR
jgi:hypothetical protein